MMLPSLLLFVEGGSVGAGVEGVVIDDRVVVLVVFDFNVGGIGVHCVCCCCCCCSSLF